MEKWNIIQVYEDPAFVGPPDPRCRSRPWSYKLFVKIPSNCMNYLHLYLFKYFIILYSFATLSCTSPTMSRKAGYKSVLQAMSTQYIGRKTGAQGLPPNLASCMTRRIRASEDKPSHHEPIEPGIQNASCFTDSVRFLRNVPMISCHKMLACQPTPQLLLQVVHLSTSVK